MKKGDIVIIITVLLLIITSSVLIFTKNKKGATVTVKENNETVYNGSLYRNKEITLKGNTIQIKNGSVKVTKADCKNQICVNHKPITESGESIICLPHKVIVSIKE